jgi:cold shock CspA family protein
MKNGYGFVSMPPNNLYFHWTNVEGDFNELQEGDPVEFNIAKNERGQEVAVNVRKRTTPQ